MEYGRICISFLMKTPCLLYSIVLLSGSLLFASCQFQGFSVLSYIRSVTRISIPANTTILSEFDQGEFEAVGKYQLDQKEVGRFLSSNPFHSIDQEHRYISHFNLYTRSGLIPLSDSIPLSDKFHLKFFYGCKEGNAWLFTINEKTGELWVEVQYPDLGGQGPSCKL